MNHITPLLDPASTRRPQVRNRVRPPDDVVRHGLRKVEQGGAKAWYDEAEGLVPPSVLGHIVRYSLYARDDLPYDE